jgi:hypothetical protein
MQPALEPQFEEQILQLYHQSMAKRPRDSAVGGHSQTGRRLLHALSHTGGKVLAAGSSDWVVFPAAEGKYPAEEAYFLHYLLETINQAVASHPELDKEKFHTWLARRHAHIEAGELIFIAHQLDMCGQVP